MWLIKLKRVLSDALRSGEYTKAEYTNVKHMKDPRPRQDNKLNLNELSRWMYSWTGICRDTGGEGRFGEGARCLRGKTRSEESLRKHNVIYELTYERKKINSKNKSCLPEPINWFRSFPRKPCQLTYFFKVFIKQNIKVIEFEYKHY